MARKFAQIHVDIWQDPDFLTLSADARWVFVATFAQKITTYAGVMPYTPSRLGHVTGLPQKKVHAAVVELDAARFLVADLDTGELLVRSYIAHNGVLAQPQLRKALERCYEDILSARIRRSIVAALPLEYAGPRTGLLADDLAAFRQGAPNPDRQGAAQAASRPRVMDRGFSSTTGVTQNPGQNESPPTALPTPTPFPADRSDRSLLSRPALSPQIRAELQTAHNAVARVPVGPTEDGERA